MHWQLNFNWSFGRGRDELIVDDAFPITTKFPSPIKIDKTIVSLLTRINASIDPSQ